MALCCPVFISMSSSLCLAVSVACFGNYFTASEERAKVYRGALSLPRAHNHNSNATSRSKPNRTLAGRPRGIDMSCALVFLYPRALVLNHVHSRRIDPPNSLLAHRNETVETSETNETQFF
jgi:hypothetical protein